MEKTVSVMIEAKKGKRKTLCPALNVSTIND
jgi:hypothetical protein